MNKTSLIIIGSALAGYAISTLNISQDIKAKDCDQLKTAYANKTLLQGGIVVLGVIITLVGVYGEV